MLIKQFEDKYLSHYSYLILSGDKAVVIDPSRDVSTYLNFAESHEARIAAIIETHPHADFVSGHLELHRKTGAPIYCSRLVNAQYPHFQFDDEELLTIGKISLTALNTPGHSPDSICILLKDGDKDCAVFTGDTLFIGDCGRPDLRETDDQVSKRAYLARKMYASLRTKLINLANEVLVYPAHGAGTLCGKALSEANSSTIGAEKLSNWSMQKMTEEEFVAKLLADQPFIPKYFPYDVELNKAGAADLKEATEEINFYPEANADFITGIDKKLIVIDTRSSQDFNKSHLPNSINLMEGTKFETWLGSIINPSEKFYLAAADEQALSRLVRRAASIGYEPFIAAAFVLNIGLNQSDELDLQHFKQHLNEYTILDIRNASESENHPVFDQAIQIPLHELRGKTSLIPLDKPIVVHCAGGYRSAAGRSLLSNYFEKVKIYDLGEAIHDYES